MCNSSWFILFTKWEKSIFFLVKTSILLGSDECSFTLLSLKKKKKKSLREIWCYNTFVSSVSYLLIEALWFTSTCTCFTPIQWLTSGSPATELLLLRNSTQLYLKYILWKGVAFLCEINMLPDWQPWKQAEQYVVFLSVFHNIANHATWLKHLKMWDACLAVISMVKQLKKCIVPIRFSLYCERALFTLS